MAQKDALLPGVGRELFDRLPYLLLWAAVDPGSYVAWAHMMLERAGVPLVYRQFDHKAVMALLQRKVEVAQPDDEES